MTSLGRLRLGINIDHVATIRNARGGALPEPLRAALLAEAAGADGITAHLREDRRHISDADIEGLMQVLSVPLNFEMAATEEMVEIADCIKPEMAMLVPEGRHEITTEGGLDVIGNFEVIKNAVEKLKAADIFVSIFVDPDLEQIEAARGVGAPGCRRRPT